MPTQKTDSILTLKLLVWICAWFCTKPLSRNSIWNPLITSNSSENNAISSKWPPHCQSIQQAHYYTTRQYLNIRLVLCKIKRLYFSFCPLQLSSGMNCPMMSNKIFPNLISNIVLTKIQIRNTPPHVVTGSRSEQTLHTRLRLNWSLFNAHLYLRNIINNPHSLCGYFLRLNIEFSIF